MIRKISFYFQTNNFTGELRDNIEEVKKDVREFLKENSDYCFIFRNEFWQAFDKNGIIIYETHSLYREFKAEEEVNKISYNGDIEDVQNNEN